MKLNLLKTEEFYPVLKYWWESHKFTPVDIKVLPEQVFVASEGDTPLYSMFLYETNSRLCWIAWQLANPEATKKQKTGGLDFLIKEVTRYAKEKGFVLAFTTSPIKPVQDSLLKADYVEGDLQVNQYFKVL
jgi:hypothetical protein